MTSAGRVDVLLAPTGIPGGYDQLILNASVATLAGGDVSLASLEDLIVMKRAASRVKARSDLDQLGGHPPPPTFPSARPGSEPRRQRDRGENIDRQR